MRRRWWRSGCLGLAVGLFVIITQISAQNTEGETQSSVHHSFPVTNMRDFIYHFCKINLAPFLQNHNFRFHSWSWWNGMLQPSVYALSEVREIIVSLSLCGSVPQIGLCVFSAHLHYRSSQIQLSKLSVWWCMNYTVTSAKDKLTTVIEISKHCWKCREAEWK